MKPADNKSQEQQCDAKLSSVNSWEWKESRILRMNAGFFPVMKLGPSVVNTTQTTRTRRNTFPQRFVSFYRIMALFV